MAPGWTASASLGAYVRSVDSQTPLQTEWVRNRGVGPCVTVLTVLSLLGDSDVCSSLRPTALETAFPPNNPGVVDWAVGPVPSLLFLGCSVVKNPPARQEMRVLSLGQEDPLDKGNGNPLQYSCLENPMDRGAW